jgi:3-hydroxyisobutyrate dehydrogenase
MRHPECAPTTNERKVNMTSVRNAALVHRAARVAVLGTGIMGAPMARNLLKAGFRVRVWNRTPDKARVLAAEGADLAETPADAVREAAFVITMLTDTAAVLAVMRQAAESVPDSAVWLQTSMDTDAERAAQLAEDHGITFVNCPVIGTRETAKHGRLVVLASGPGDALDRAQPIFDAIGSKTVRLEPETGRASRMKLVATAWAVGLAESLRCQVSRAARGLLAGERVPTSERHL